MRSLVTGSEGFIGRHLCEALRARGDVVIGLDLKSGEDVCDCDLPDANLVFHLAAQTNAYFEDAIVDAEVNIIGSLRIFRRYGSRTVFASSAMVNYPATPYAIAKRACEAYAALYGVAVVRLPNVTGRGGHSVFEAFEAADELMIYGSGEQRRSYVSVDKAVSALMEHAGKGGVRVVGGVDLTVNQVADMHPGKPRRHLPARPLDMMDARQVA